MTTTKEYSYQEEKLESLLNNKRPFYKNKAFENQTRLLDDCFLSLQDYTVLSPAERENANDILHNLEGYIKDLYRIHRAAKEEGFYVLTFSQKITLNPYCKEEKSEEELAEMRRKLFKHKIRHLRYEEIFNIYLFLERLFDTNGILDWLDLISDWRNEIEKDYRSIQNSEIQRPAWTFFHFHQMLEAYYIIIKSGVNSHPNTPTEYYDSNNAVVHSDTAVVINPFEYLECLIYDVPIVKMKTDIKLLFDYATKDISDQEKTPLELINIANYLKALMETTYLVTKTPYVLDEWLKPEMWSRFSNYVRPNLEPISFEYLSQKERKKPHKIIKKELWSMWKARYTLEIWEEYALDPDRKLENRFDDFTKINKIIEAIYVIYYELLSKEQIAIEDTF